MSGSTEPERIETYRFTPENLAIARRLPGISAFMRIRNGADCLEATIRSHIDAVDEIVAVYNRCTDKTPDILMRLAQEFGPKLRVVHYLPEVFPQGSEGHMREPADAPRSMVTYSNFALSQTRFTHAMKLDDDHLAMAGPLGRLAGQVRAGAIPDDEMACFSGVNLARDESGAVGALRSNPLAGSGDHGFFRVRTDSVFVHDPRYEKFSTTGLRRRFRGFLYWHLKHLKDGFGFGNYDLAENPRSRFARKRAAYLAERAVVPPAAIATLMSRSDRALVALRRVGVPLPDKAALLADRWLAVRGEAGSWSIPAELGDRLAA